MVRTQILIPDALNHEAKRLAQEKEWSLAEMLRKGLEDLIERYPSTAYAKNPQWSIPSSAMVGWQGLSDIELKNSAFKDSESRIINSLAK
jgi:hypothetical protein